MRIFYNISVIELIFGIYYAYENVVVQKISSVRRFCVFNFNNLKNSEKVQSIIFFLSIKFKYRAAGDWERIKSPSPRTSCG